jgi:hypothetical protein
MWYLTLLLKIAVWLAIFFALAALFGLVGGD